MRFPVGSLVIARKRIIESACGDHPEFQLCEKGQRLKVQECFPVEKHPKHGVDSYSVQDEKGTYGNFFMDCSELEEPTAKQKYKN